MDDLGKATLFAVSPERPEHSRKLIEQRKLNFEILHDPENEVGRSFGLRWKFPDDLKAVYLKFGIDLAQANGEDGWTLAIPARYIISTEGIIRYARVDPDYTRRPEPSETLDALKSIV